MSPIVRKLALLVHVACSVGWLGAVLAFLALAVTGFTSGDAELARGAYLAMGVTMSYVIVPASIASLSTGLASSIGSPFGVFKQHWVIAKLVLTVGAVLLLFVHTQPVDILAEAASARALAWGELRELRFQVVADAIGAVIVLLANTSLGVFKPRGSTRYGRNEQDEGAPSEAARVPRWVIALAIATLALLLVLKASTGGLGGHGPGRHGAPASSP